ncbi:unnamed protein product [Polarella glacialis]|uniref:Uncharacterized protein n=1 Tax=Polarella glacialis TaxID=89957 RepID=A0A813JBN6_POLGL|nr:unnamed protein product [Polarella glacialis]
MCTPTTYSPVASGPTFWSPLGKGSRVDYISVPWAAKSQVTSVAIWRKSAMKLQSFRTEQPRDHCPIRLQMQAAVGHEYKVDTNLFRWSYTAMKDPVKVRQFCEVYEQWRNQPETKEKFDNALQ